MDRPPMKKIYGFIPHETFDRIVEAKKFGQEWDVWLEKAIVEQLKKEGSW